VLTPFVAGGRANALRRPKSPDGPEVRQIKGLDIDGLVARRSTYFGRDRFGDMNAPHGNRHGSARTGQGTHGLGTDTRGAASDNRLSLGQVDSRGSIIPEPNENPRGGIRTS
jgi:hypothetical protein